MNLKLLRGDNCVETFQGNGPIPYAAIRDSYKKAREFLTNINGEFSNGVHAEEDIEREDEGPEESESRGREGEVERKNRGRHLSCSVIKFPADWFCNITVSLSFCDLSHF